MKPVEYKALSQPTPGQATQRALVHIWPDRVEVEYRSVVTKTVLGGEVIPARDVCSVTVTKSLLMKPLVTVTLRSGEVWAVRLTRAADAERCKQVLEHIRDSALAEPSASGEPRRVRRSGPITPTPVPKSKRYRFVVGTAHHQPGFGNREYGPALFVLRPEPDNRYDPHAVAVDLDGRNVGYLKRDTGYFEALAGRSLLVAGYIEHFNGGYGAAVHIPGPKRLAQFLNGQVDHIDIRRARLKELGKYRETLHRLIDGQQYRAFPCTLEVHPALRGKYQGQPCIQALVDGQVVGTLTARWQAEEAETFDAVVTRGQREAWVHLTSHHVEDGDFEEVVAYLSLDGDHDPDDG